jgi:myo-inositol-1(or 4)-monophosphatase
MLGSAPADLSHVGLGITKAYWDYQIKQWIHYAVN